MRGRDLTTRDVVTVSPETSARDAAALPAARDFTALPVADGSGALVGVVTEADALRDRLPPDPRPLVHGQPSRARAVPRRTVADVTSEPVTGASPGTDIAEPARQMPEHGARSLGHHANPHRWTVSVVDGRVAIVDELDDERDRLVAAVPAGAVPGVADVSFPETRRAVDHG
ncbi:CBS domain-containing protein [Saccharothrix texasensis]|uniref:CBS domain protein n=1 Tax=Saccharothrix texasensis TaxID=103734 RepID=A0A3N1GXT7_9PSEU|nr:CBS domain-containing protein [Saccharothrix texasensis]ROP35084.1 CBS domain protein [Saccharothrix texasensis]